MIIKKKFKKLKKIHEAFSYIKILYFLPFLKFEIKKKKMSYGRQNVICIFNQFYIKDRFHQKNL